MAEVTQTQTFETNEEGLPSDPPPEQPEQTDRTDNDPASRTESDDEE